MTNNNVKNSVFWNSGGKKILLFRYIKLKCYIIVNYTSIILHLLVFRTQKDRLSKAQTLIAISQYARFKIICASTWFSLLLLSPRPHIICLWNGCNRPNPQRSGCGHLTCCFSDGKTGWGVTLCRAAKKNNLLWLKVSSEVTYKCLMRKSQGQKCLLDVSCSVKALHPCK